MEKFAVVVEGLENLKDYADIKERAHTAALRAINKTATWARTRAARAVLSQVNLPASYVSPQSGRLAVVAKANGSKLSATIRARSRPTSLARFVKAGTVNKPGVRVEVQPGKSKNLRQAFLIRLRAGTADLDTKSNLGLAIRLKPGETVRGKYSAIKMSRGLYLLYGPSVQQVLMDNKGEGVYKDIEDNTAGYLEAEFLRLMEI